MTHRISLVIYFFTSMCSCAISTTRPIVGILSQPLYDNDFDPPSKDYIAASYVKYVESAGARVVPIHYNDTESMLITKFNQVNGILFPGGAVDLGNSTTYYKAGKILFDAAVKANLKGDYFPLWGTCLGFEQLLRLLSGSNDEILTRGFDSKNYTLPLVPAFPGAIEKSRLFHVRFIFFFNKKFQCFFRTSLI
eukprot:GSMAST32.ASY1.ANO1.2773.1 assembled CDS